MRYLLFTCLISATFLNSFSQTEPIKEKKSQFYFSWGYTRAAYSKSTIHFKNSSGPTNVAEGEPIRNYDFTIHDVKAHDRADLDKIKDVINVTIPQFVFRIGYSFNNKWGIELNFDHTKYVVTDWQRTHINGQINGTPIDKDTTMNPDRFLHFEHTDGANFWMINAVRRWALYNPNKQFTASWVLKPGAGVVVPRTDVTMFGHELNNDWHLAGWIVGVESGLRLEFFRNGFFEFVGKGSYADYMKCLVLGKGNGSANHRFFTAQLTATLGLKFGARK